MKAFFVILTINLVIPFMASADYLDAVRSELIIVEGEIIAVAEGEPLANNGFAMPPGFLDSAPTIYFVVRYEGHIYYCMVASADDYTTGLPPERLTSCLD